MFYFRKGRVLLAAVIVIAAVAVVGVFFLSKSSGKETAAMGKELAVNGAETYILEVMEQQSNSKALADGYDELVVRTNGFCESEIEQINEIYKSSSDYKNGIDNRKKEFEYSIANYVSEYGEDWKIELQYVSKTGGNEDDYKATEDRLKEYSVKMKDAVKTAESWNLQEWENFADITGISVEQAKTYVNAVNSIAEKYGNADVQEAYNINYICRISGSKLENPKEFEDNIGVYKIDGIWVDFGTMHSIGNISNEFIHVAMQ